MAIWPAVHPIFTSTARKFEGFVPGGLGGGGGSEQPIICVVDTAQGVVVEDKAADAAVFGEDPGLGLDLLGSEDTTDGR